MNDPISYEAIVRRYERTTSPRLEASGLARSQRAQLRLGSVRLPVRMQDGKIVALGTCPLPRKALGELLAGLERACGISAFTAGGSVS